MPILNDSENLRFGAEQVLRVMNRGVQVWVAPEVPANLTLPTIVGSATVGSTVALNNGTWSGSPTSYARQLQIYNEVSSEWDDVVGGTGSTFEFLDEGDYRLRVIATNAAGDSDPEYSATMEVEDAPAGTLIVFAGATANSTLSNGNRTLTRTSGAYANCLASAPLTEDCYFEFELSGLDDASMGMYAGTSPLSTSVALGQWWGEPGLSAGSAAWSADFYALYGPTPMNGRMATYDGPATPPVQIHGAYRHATRSLWLRVRAGGVTYPWANSGDPEAGTTPSVVFPGSNPVFLGGTADGSAVTLLLPDEFNGTVPTGFVKGAYSYV